MLGFSICKVYLINSCLAILSLLLLFNICIYYHNYNMNVYEHLIFLLKLRLYLTESVLLSRHQLFRAFTVSVGVVADSGFACNALAGGPTEAEEMFLRS